jgi:hypothetical protein
LENAAGELSLKRRVRQSTMAGYNLKNEMIADAKRLSN